MKWFEDIFTKSKLLIICGAVSILYGIKQLWFTQHSCYGYMHRISNSEV